MSRLITRIRLIPFTLLPLFCHVPASLAAGDHGLEVVTVEDHSQALPLLLGKSLKSMTVLHVDAHDDLWPPPSRDQLRQALSLSRRRQFDALERYGRYYAPPAKKLYGINNYLVLAHRLGLVSRVYWAYPVLGSLDRKTLENIKEDLVARDPKADLAGARELVVSPPFLTGALSGVPVTIGSLSDFPHTDDPVLLDIDLDFFPPLYKTPVTTSWLGLMSGFASTLFESLRVRPVLAVVSYSHDGGHFPVSLRFLGGWQAKILADRRILDSEPPPNWVLKDEAVHLDFFLQFAEAASVYRRILESEPADADAHYSLAICLMKLGETDMALASLRKACSLDPRYISGFLDAAAVPGEVGDAGGVLKILNAAEEIAPRSGVVLDALGTFHYNRGEYREAIRYYRKVIDVGEGSALTHAYLGDCYRLDRQSRKAESEYGKAIRLHSAQPDSYLPAIYWRRLAEAREALGKTAGALRAYRDFRDRFPNAPPEDASFVKERIDSLTRSPR
jgi:tetratricopeptide (TPR) repeat protein